MSMLSPRKMYVTIEEHRKLLKLGLEYDFKRISTDEFVQAVHELTGVNKDILLRHRWTIVVPEDGDDRMPRRCGLNWATRGLLQDRIDRNNPVAVASAQRRAIDSLKVIDK